jgi:PAS domain-containing protein
MSRAGGSSARGAIQDLSEHRRLLAQPAESEERLGSLARATVDTVRDWNPRTDEIGCSGGLLARFGRSPEEVEPGQYVMVMVIVMVTATGSGFEPDALGRVFAPLCTTKEFGRGTGLGLRAETMARISRPGKRS